MAVIIDGKELAKKIRANLKIECEELKKKNINSKLAVIMVGEDPASKVYVRNKSRACEDVGIKYEEYLLDVNTTQKELVELIEKLSNDKSFYLNVSNACAQRAKEFDINIMAQKYEEVYKNIFPAVK